MMDGSRIDLHMHSTVSDGTDTPEELVDQVRKTKIELFALTDHDAVKGCTMVRKTLRKGDPQFLSGVEFSCRDEKGKYHILGYGFDPDSPAILQPINLGHSYRMRKVQARLDFLEQTYNFTFPKEEIDSLMSLDNPGKPHIGNLMVKYGYAPDKDVAIKEYLNRLRMKNEYLRPEEAIRGILGSGGIPVLAHPAFGSGDELFLGEEMEARLLRLMEFGLKGMEVYYSGFTPKLISEMQSLAEKYSLYVTAGSDYHGRNKLVELGDTHMDMGQVMPDGMRRFLEDVLN
ncbi:MAG: PHP domain-containing protein [bacterium]